MALLTEEGKLYKEALEILKDDIIELIELNFEGEKNMSPAEAEVFLGQSVKGWTQESIDAAVEDIQLKYYTEGICSFEELIQKFVELNE